MTTASAASFPSAASDQATTPPATPSHLTVAARVRAQREGRVWLITGASRGLGRAFAEAALAAGDRVVAISRTVGSMDDLAAAHRDRLLSFSLDVTDRAAVFAAVAEAVARFGRLDVVVNNAGFLTMGMVEELTEEQARAQFEVNFFGALWVSQAVLPTLREQGSGHIVQISSIGALAGHPLTGIYGASKSALEGMSEALAAEVAEFGVKLTIVEPGGYWTDLYTTGLVATEPQPQYAPLRAELERRFAEGSVDSPPDLAARALLALVEAEDPPLHLLLGSMVYDLAFEISQQRMDTWAAWEEVSRAAERAVPAPGASAS
ncbi:SDR family NAD(P)-dependent oxidoreductase [Streptomyces sp. 3MP-14]|uniref:SDR family NAD(P)-dependent oxidoreductase n=1 Tax=Streptomyces mimosae TaxID=2586635 RepID=A0A5N6AQ18_9ACTN|nr:MULTISPECIES: SDR family NAD(P)-dependent oxidoreductase [Streptomyces]KAB8170947.1 SDR family NAD(P)-dependent oxidoreductase [Streptomyces mimosae]KAB8179702.1 SDR family NAD(P)-dependent oxidoreductase [Streptomyces sp. 3MP-14]